MVYDSCSDARVRVEVDGTEIPTTSVETTVSTDGNADITKITEVKYPLKWGGKDIASQITAFSPNSEATYSKATVSFQNVRSGKGGDYYDVHYGFVRGGGGTDKSGEGKFYVDDPSSMFSSIPFSGKYDRPSVGTVLKDVVSEFNANSPFNASAGSVDNETVADDGILSTFLRFGFGIPGAILANSKSFKSNRHTLADVMKWVTETENGRWYFGYDGGLKLVYDNDDSTAITYNSHGMVGRGASKRQLLNSGGRFTDGGGPYIDIIENDAISEINPVNTLTVHGKTGIALFGYQADWIPADKFPAVTVEYPPFVKAANGQNVTAGIQETKSVSLEAAEGAAKRKLAEQMRGASQGDILCYGRPDIEPFDRIVAPPECSDMFPNQNVTPVEYEVTAVTHRKESTKELRTTVDVGPHIDESKIAVSESEMKSQ